MSFIDGIFNGITGAVKDVLGIHDAPRQNSDDSSHDAKTSGRTASSVETKYEPTSAAASGSSDDSRFSLLGYLQSNVAQRNTTADAGEPASGAVSPRPAAGSGATGVAGARSSRLDSALASAGVREPIAQFRTSARAQVFDGSDTNYVGDADQLASSGGDAAVAARNVQRGLDYFHDTFGRDGLDNAGSAVEVIVGDHSTDDSGQQRFKGNGGYYAMPDGRGGYGEAVHFGEGTSYDAARGRVDQKPMQYAEDLTIHELVHGVIRKESGYLGGQADEAGATNEAIADVLAASATRDWKLGEGMYTASSDYKLMRNIANPDDPTAIHGLWTSMDDVRRHQQAGEEIEEHWASGVISTAAYRMQQRLGGEAGWQAVEQVFYGAIEQHRLGDMSFESVANALRGSAASLYGDRSSQEQIVDEELRRAGL
ncbi:MAG: M4 family metallopeptidase [Thermoleophilia bacterium]|nr:M4 family metallopeptidase [Thermoleophilia bacterium]